MNKIKLVVFATVILLFLITLVSCRNKNPPAFDISKGTTVIGLLDSDSILLAADSRETNTHIENGNTEISYVDTVKKIYQVGKFFFTLAGSARFRDVNVSETIKNNYNAELPIDSNIANIDVILKGKLTTFANSFDANDLQHFQHNNLPELYIIFAGYERSLPCLKVLDIIVAKDHDGYKVTDTISSGVIGQMGIGGFKSDIYKTNRDIIQSHKIAGSLHWLIWLISLEARFNPLAVDSNVHYVVIKPQSIYEGKNY